MPGQENRDAYDAGHVAGGIEARLAGHDKHFAAINGSIAQVADELRKLNLAIQRLSDQAQADRSTVVVTALALKDAKEVADRASTARWNPWQKAAVVIGAMASLGGLIALIVRLT